MTPSFLHVSSAAGRATRHSTDAVREDDGHEPVTWLDEHLLDVVAAHRTGWATEFARDLMDAGTSLAVLVAAALFASGVVVARRAYRPAAAVTIAVIGSIIAAAVGPPTSWRAGHSASPSGLGPDCCAGPEPSLLPKYR
jgi:hypothetical protein